MLNIFKKKEKHQHVWDIIAKTYISPVSPEVLGVVGKLEGEALDKALFGFTLYISECQCGERSSNYVLGLDLADQQPRVDWEAVFDKVLKEGPQLVESEKGEKFLLGKYTPIGIPIKGEL